MSLLNRFHRTLCRSATPVAIALSVQCASATITITDGTVTFTMRDGTHTGGAWAADLFTDASSPDHLFRNQWYYRTESQIMEHQLSSDNNTDEGASGDTGFIEWSESGFDFRLDLYIHGGVPIPEANIIQAMRVTNTTAQTQQIHLFNYVDFEFGGFLSPNFSQRDAYGIEITNPTIADTVARIETNTIGIQPQHWQIDDGLNILDELNDFFVTTLTDSNTQTFDDATAVFEFVVSVDPGQTVTLSDYLQILADPFPADLNQDGNLDFFDLSLFIDLFNHRLREADFTNDGEFDFFDVSAFLVAFNRDAGN